MKPHVAKAEELGIRIAIENYSGQAVYHSDSLRYFAEFNQSVHLGIAFAPHHLHRWADQILQLLRDLGDRNVPFIYLQEYSEAMQTNMAKEIEMKQLPGFGGTLDYKPIVAAVRDIQFRWYVEIFMETVPRGTSILPTVGEITAAINKSRNHVENCLNEVL